ncbi:MAG: lipopolysaccharide transport periplasmic protein LptA [Rhizobiaceae bacterium]|nr:lipopolysaccharide transport periplasmic protein LptA [Rhizobiaceae bacterium]
MKFSLRSSIFQIALILLAACFATAAQAQVSGQAFEGFRGNSKDPVQIEADQLEVLDAEAKAIFEGNVKVRQGTSLITTARLEVKYLKGSKGGQNDIEKLTMTGGLIATSKENTVTAEKGTYRVKTEDIVLTGNVVVSQGANVASGCKLVANLKTNQAKLEACAGGGRVKSVFTPGTQP